ncbi:MAG: hypothetical protein GC204_01080 [Chloroflexi bacterium]|nr:hypothetical protein [Chloroflexota bacterium]
MDIQGFLVGLERDCVEARSRVLSQGIAVENADMVAAAVVAFDRVISTIQKNGGSPSEIISAPSPMPETFAEWATHYGMKSHVDRYVVCAVYLYNQNPGSTVSINEIMDMYTKARWQKPKNPSDVFGKSAERLFFVSVDDASDRDTNLKMWRLTRTAMKHFETLKREDE